MSEFSLSGRRFSEDDSKIQILLKASHAKSLRPRCLCQDDGIEMYIARFNDEFLIKRMPGSAQTHAISCSRYEFPNSLSGKGQVLGKAIVENQQNDTAKISFAFSLSKGKARTAATAVTGSTSIKPTASKLSLRGLLDYLFDEAGLTKMEPNFHKRRNWSVVSRLLNQAMLGKSAKEI